MHHAAYGKSDYIILSFPVFEPVLNVTLLVLFLNFPNYNAVLSDVIAVPPDVIVVLSDIIVFM
jgi:hypothetical protein